MYFAFSLPKLTPTSGTYAAWTNSIGHALIDYIDLMIGETLIDRHYGLFLEIWNELTTKPGRRSSEDQLIGKLDHPGLIQNDALVDTNYTVPLKFWFCNNIGSSLPLISLQYTKIRLLFKLRPFSECIVYDGTTPPLPVNIYNTGLLTEYIFMDDTERLKYLNNKVDYIINQTQYFNDSVNTFSGGHKSQLTFNHPCTELIFVLREITSEQNNDWFNFAQRNVLTFTPVLPILSNAQLTIDGNNILDLTSENILRIVNSNRYHTQTVNKHIYIIPFANEPEKWYPSGSLNFSFADFVELYLNFAVGSTPSNLYVFARNFNVVTIDHGMLSILFSS
jgi:hypothetical protein